MLWITSLFLQTEWELATSFWSFRNSFWSFLFCTTFERLLLLDIQTMGLLLISLVYYLLISWLYNPSRNTCISSSGMDLWVLILFAHIFGTALRPVLQAIKGIQHSVSKIQFFERKSLVFTLFFSFYFYKQIMRMVAETPIPTLRFILLFTNHSF